MALINPYIQASKGLYLPRFSTTSSVSSVQTVEVITIDQDIDVSKDLTVLDTRMGVGEFTLGAGKDGQLKAISLSGPASATVKTVRGSILLSMNELRDYQLVFTGGDWSIMSPNTSFVPTTHVKTLTGADLDAYMGGSVALSADGNTLAAGASSFNASAGAVMVFNNVNGVWEGDFTTLTGYTGDQFKVGSSTALSANGNTLVASAPSFQQPGLGSFIGAALVFNRANGTWSNSFATLTGADGHDANMGSSVALSADGDTLAAGAPRFDQGGTVGAVMVFNRVAGEWEDDFVTLTGYNILANMGISVALSADGNTLATGNTLFNHQGVGEAGAVTVFNRVNGVWQENDFVTLTGVDGQAARIGSSVALSADGNTLVAGAPNFGVLTNGAAMVFNRIANKWDLSETLTGYVPIGESDAKMGQSVALSADGQTLAVGASKQGGDTGVTYVYNHAANNWNFVKTFTGLADSFMGTSVALSVDGNTLASGVPSLTHGGETIGAAFVFN